jgi:hypothetical protein
MILTVADATSYLIDHLTALLIVVALCATFLLLVWIVVLFLLSRHRYPSE